LNWLHIAGKSIFLRASEQADELIALCDGWFTNNNNNNNGDIYSLINVIQLLL